MAVLNAINSAVVPELTLKAYFTPINLANSSSNFCTSSPPRNFVVNPER